MEEQQQAEPITNDYLIDQQRRLIAAMQARAILDPFSGQKIICNGDVFAHYPKIYQIASAIDGLKALYGLIDPHIAQNEEKKQSEENKN